MLHSEMVDPRHGIVLCPRLACLEPLLNFCTKMQYTDSEVDLILESVFCVATADEEDHVTFAIFEEQLSQLITESTLNLNDPDTPSAIIDAFRNVFFIVCSGYAGYLLSLRDSRSEADGYLALMFHKLTDDHVMLHYDDNFYSTSKE